MKNQGLSDVPFVKIAKALADPTRHKILQEIRASGEMTCTEVCDRFRLAQPTISHHIKTLARAGVIKVRPEGQYHVLSVNERTMKDFAAQLVPARSRESAKPRKAVAGARR